jgi:hypothetical protein
LYLKSICLSAGCETSQPDIPKPNSPKIAINPVVARRPTNVLYLSRLIKINLKLLVPLWSVVTTVFCDFEFISTKYEIYVGSIAKPHGLIKATTPAVNANPMRTISIVSAPFRTLYPY